MTANTNTVTAPVIITDSVYEKGTNAGKAARAKAAASLMANGDFAKAAAALKAATLRIAAAASSEDSRPYLFAARVAVGEYLQAAGSEITAALKAAEESTPAPAPVANAGLKAAVKAGKYGKAPAPAPAVDVESIIAAVTASVLAAMTAKQ